MRCPAGFEVVVPARVGARPINDPLLTHGEVVFRGRSLLEDDYGAGASMKEPREGAAATS